MDNKITKKRLKDYLSYEWGIIAILLVVIILVWDFVFGLCSTPLTVGQEYGIFLDKNVARGGGDLGFFVSRTLSYEIMSFKVEEENDKEQILQIKSEVGDSDIIFTDIFKSEEENSTDKSIRLHTIIDNYAIIDFQTLLRNACDYLGKHFVRTDDYPYIKQEEIIAKNKEDISMSSLKEKVEILTASKIEEEKIVYTNIDNERIKTFFLSRMKNDNRYRTQKEKDAGIILEIERINILIKAVGEFYTLLEKGKDIELFCNYTKYLQRNELGDVTIEEIKNNGYQGNNELMKMCYQETELGRENVPYALNLGKLTYDKNGEQASSKKNIHQYLQLAGTLKADNVVLSVFDFTQYQPDTQYESIVVINNIVKNFSDILD